jgi:serine/threonine protein kinase
MNATTCHPDLIDDFLADRLDANEQRAFELHLDECDHCCAALQQRTASEEMWTDTRSFLSSSDNAGLESRSPGRADSTSINSIRLDFLAPTDDPRMLGRFGGYEISGVIGCGGMGIVLKGFDPALNRYSAIKVLAPHYASNGAARQRFAREAQAAAAVVHDNVIAIHGVDEFNGLPYLVMPYVKGLSLQKRIARDGPLSTAEILRIALQTARGLAAAHDQGLVHRDIKPGNILLPESVERVVITDFGLARAADDASLTRSGVIAGTPQYMSPEQARGEGIDTRSDLFSLGSVIYAMCTGHPPFRAETPYGILRRITDNEARPIREINPDVPDWLCRIVDRLLAKNPDDRFQSAEATAQVLEDCLAHVQKPDEVPLPEAVRTRVTTHSNNKLFAAAALCLLCVVVAWTQWPNSQPRTVEHFGPEAPSISGEEISRVAGDERSEPPEVVREGNLDSETGLDPELTALEVELDELDMELTNELDGFDD